MDHYESLGVARSAPPEVIRAAWRALAQLHHPDRNKSPEATETFKRLQKAYQVLSDPAARAAYDQELRVEGAGSSETPTFGATDQAQGWDDAWNLEGLSYVLHFRHGFILDHREWVEYQSVQKTDGRLFVGRGRYTAIEGTPKQHICVRMSGRDEFVERDGLHIPVVSSQPVTLVSVELPGRSQAVPIILINRATQQWHAVRDLFIAMHQMLPREWGSRRITGALNARAIALVIFIVTTLFLARHLPWFLAALGAIPVVLLFGSIVRSARTRAAVRVLRTHLSAAGIN